MITEQMLWEAFGAAINQALVSAGQGKQALLAERSLARRKEEIMVVIRTGEIEAVDNKTQEVLADLNHEMRFTCK